MEYKKHGLFCSKSTDSMIDMLLFPAVDTADISLKSIPRNLLILSDKQQSWRETEYDVLQNTWGAG
jgi:hypothetical protein